MSVQVCELMYPYVHLVMCVCVFAFMCMCLCIFYCLHVFFFGVYLNALTRVCLCVSSFVPAVCVCMCTVHLSVLVCMYLCPCMCLNV